MLCSTANLYGMDKCTYIDGIASSQTIDSSGEVVSLEGLDISSLVHAAYNWEHTKDLPAQIVGKILEAKKIFSKEDCENDRHLYYWNKCQLPFLYVMGRLFDDNKPSSKEVAALFQDDNSHPGEKDIVGFSVEGSRLGEKQGVLVPRSIARKVTITNLPCNKTCIAEILPINSAKNDDISSLFKGEMELFKFEPTYKEIMKLEELNKSLEAGSGMAAPSQLTGGAALGKEELKPKKLQKKEKTKWFERADQAYQGWGDREKFKGYMKKRMPHLADGEVDSIGRLLALKKDMEKEKGLSKMYASYFGKAELEKGSDIMMASEETHIHGLPKGHPSLGEHKGHTYRRTTPPTAGSDTWSWAVRNPAGKDSKVDLPGHTAGSKDSIHAHIDSKMNKK